MGSITNLDSSTTLGSPQSSRSSKSSSTAKMILPIAEPKPTLTSSKQPRSKWSVFSGMPSFGHAFAGVPPAPVNTAKTRRDAESKIFITVPSPTVGGLNDELILQMVGAGPVRKVSRSGQSAIELDAMEKGSR